MDDIICPSNAELMAASGLTNDSAVARKIRRLKEYRLIKVHTKGGYRRIYVAEIDKWTAARKTAGANMAPYTEPESLTTIQEQCVEHGKQLAAAGAWFESYKVKPMRTLDWRNTIQESSYGVVNYSAIGWR